MTYKLNSLEKNSIINLFDFDYDDFFFSENCDRKELIEALCYFLSFFSNQKGIENIQSIYYLIQDSVSPGKEKQFFKNFILVNEILINKYNFLFLKSIQKYLDTMSKLEADRNQYTSSTCEECYGDGEVFCNEEKDYIICMECGGCGEIQVYNFNWDVLYEKDIDTIKHIELNFKKNIKNIINSVVQIVLEENLHPNIGDVYKHYKTTNNLKDF
tara:strand:- start:12290 stop:12931 length:642 start_codon:yes stop_codon:yes gene_type:complete